MLSLASAPFKICSNSLFKVDSDPYQTHLCGPSKLALSFEPEGTLQFCVRVLVLVLKSVLALYFLFVAVAIFRLKLSIFCITL